MLRLARNVAPILVACVGLILLCVSLSPLPGQAALRATIAEQISGETPQAKIDAYVRNVAKGDEKAALNVWDLPTWELPKGRSVELKTRRDNVTRTLITQGIKPDALILSIEWWGTCCEPRVINDSRSAGGARVRVQLLDRSGAPLIYLFDVFTREQPYWGEALAYPPRQWSVRDVYALGQEPLFWRLTYESSIRWLD